MQAVDNWWEEKQSAWLYHQMVQAERDAGKRKLFAALADAAESQARIWESQLAETGGVVPEFHPPFRARIVATLIRVLGPRAVRPVLAAIKVRGLSVYRRQLTATGHPMPRSVEEVSQSHRAISSGGNFRAAVFGVNDGLVSNTGLIMGVAGATGDAAFIITSGVAGMLAGALSMAAGEYVSMRSQREMYEYQIGLERDELRQYPDEEAEELALIYNARGMSLHEARSVAEEIMQDPEHALDVLAREELGLNPDDLGSPWGAALFSFLSFSAGAVIPLLPFLAATGSIALVSAASLAAVSLFGVGAILSLFTGRDALWSGLRMVGIGGTAGLITYAIGSLLGVGLIA